MLKLCKNCKKLEMSNIIVNSMQKNNGLSKVINMRMSIKEIEKNALKIKSNKVREFIFIMAVIIVLFYLLKVFNRNNSVGYVYSVATFIMVINTLMVIISIVICLILYKKTNDQIMFT